MIEIINQSVLTKADHKIVLKVKRFVVRDRSCCVLVGPNGSGKSALMKTICGFGPFYLTGKPQTVLAKHRFVYLDAEPLAGVERWVSGADVIRLFCRADEQAYQKIVASAVADQFSKQVGVKLQNHDLLISFSSGERQALIALAARNVDARLWVLDECFSALDPPQVDGVLGVVREVAKQIAGGGGALVITTHDCHLLNDLVAAASGSGLPVDFFGLRQDGSCRECSMLPGDVKIPLTAEEFGYLYLSLRTSTATA